MNYPHLHLLVNHIPIVGAFVALVILLWGLLRRSRDVTLLALWATVVFAGAGYGAYFTGEEAHEQLEELPGYDHDRVHEHEEAGELAWYALLASGGLAVVALVLSRGGRATPGWASGAVLLGLAVGGAAGVRAGQSGGVIQHEEIRGPITEPPRAPVLPSALPADSAAALGHSHDDDAKDGETHVHEDGKEHTH